jgi:hypothetical protein
VDFKEAVAALEAFESEGASVEASVWGSDEDSD